MRTYSFRGVMCTEEREIKTIQTHDYKEKHVVHLWMGETFFFVSTICAAYVCLFLKGDAPVHFFFSVHSLVEAHLICFIDDSRWAPLTRSSPPRSALERKRRTSTAIRRRRHRLDII